MKSESRIDFSTKVTAYVVAVLDGIGFFLGVISTYLYDSMAKGAFASI